MAYRWQSVWGGAPSGRGLSGRLVETRAGGGVSVGVEQLTASQC